MYSQKFEQGSTSEIFFLREVGHFRGKPQKRFSHFQNGGFFFSSGGLEECGTRVKGERIRSANKRTEGGGGELEERTFWRRDGVC